MTQKRNIQIFSETLELSYENFFSRDFFSSGEMTKFSEHYKRDDIYYRLLIKNCY